METINQGLMPGETIRTGKPPLEFSKADKGMTAGMLACGFLFWEWIMANGGQPALGVTLFIAVLCAFSLLYYRQAGIRPSPAGFAALAAVCLSGAQFTLFATMDLQFFNFLFLSSAFLYWTALTSGTRLTGRLSGYILGDLFNQWLIVPFSNFAALPAGIRQSLKGTKKGREIFGAAVGFLIFLPVLLLVISLLSGADDAFSDFWNNLVRHLMLADLGTWLLEFILGIPVACYLYGVLYGNARKLHTGNLTHDGIAAGLRKLRVAPGAALYAPLAAFNLLYLLFFIALGGYLFSAFFGDLPDTMTYAEYARKGFFELCGVAAINLGVLALVYTLMKREKDARPAPLRFLTGLMSAFTLLLVATAMSKMLLYIASYGLTRLRVYTSWFMLLLFIAFLLIALWHVRRFDLSKPLILVFAIAFIALTYANTDGIIAKYNIERHAAGELASLDYYALAQLSDAAAPYLFEVFENAEDPEEKAQARLALLCVGGYGYAYPVNPSVFDFAGSKDSDIIQQRPFGRHFNEWNRQTARADALRAAVL
ncbi:MAG: DUF4173 domain-containing protein [Clostridiales Family XIII bacterium]|jgi:hypothetical protein|nr:DUF4173 domain-containing protein [Clostridiales Family XIII bacterium]